uniref:Uncharacterized protein n=1 Tax=Sphaerodactylus townsendi TaxID=933632 RepID=A0ACB8EEM5_9SAUR
MLRSPQRNSTAQNLLARVRGALPSLAPETFHFHWARKGESVHWAEGERLRRYFAMGTPQCQNSNRVTVAALYEDFQARLEPLKGIAGPCRPAEIISRGRVSGQNVNYALCHGLRAAAKDLHFLYALRIQAHVSVSSKLFPVVGLDPEASVVGLPKKMGVLEYLQYDVQLLAAHAEAPGAVMMDTCASLAGEGGMLDEKIHLENEIGKDRFRITGGFKTEDWDVIRSATPEYENCFSEC